MGLIINPYVFGAAPPSTPQTMYGTAVPTHTTGYDGGTYYNLGTRFSLSKSGTITHIRFLFSEGTASTRTFYAYIYNRTTTAILSGRHDITVSGSTATRWIEYQLPSALAVSASTNYVVSVSNSLEDNGYPLNAQHHASAITTGDITMPVAAGCFYDAGSSGSTMPNSTFNNTAYFRDIIFVAN